MRLRRSLSVALFFITALAACRSSSTTESSRPAPLQPSQLTGRQLAQAHCGNCHQFPNPALLDKATWQNGVLPNMALRLGVSKDQMTFYYNFDDLRVQQRIIASGLFPVEPVIHRDDWQKIQTYYQNEAPSEPLPQVAHAPIRVGLPGFQVQQSKRAVNSLVTLLRYDSLSRRIWVGDKQGNLFALDQQLEVLDSLQISSPPVDFRPHRDGSLDLLAIGIMNPNDQQAGSWERIALNEPASTTLLNQLQRPVHTAYADFNHDGREDVVVCQFGNYLGKLTWHEQLPNGYREHVLDPVPGARRTLIRDLNQDGWPDIIALLTQGDEQIAVYYNQRNSKFKKETVLRFPPVYGSSYVELVDIDRDGDEDFVYTNGDNADYSTSLKAYHGVRIFLNDGRFHFKQVWFYSMHGASQVLARDFDQDGDVDLAATAYFPNYAQEPNQSFIYFENAGNLQFIARTFANAERGRWLTMDAGDVDQDGDEDILLGSFFQPIGQQYAKIMTGWGKPGAGVTLLRNTMK